MQSEFHLISAFVDGKWQPDEVAEGNPLRRVRQILGGGWERAKGVLSEDRAMAAFRGERRVLVLRMPDHFDRAAADAALRQIHEETT